MLLAFLENEAYGQGFAAAFGKTPPRGPFAFGE
jgi:hypothetical protein